MSGLDPIELHRAAVQLGACRHPTVTLEDKPNGRGREYVARVLLEEGEAVGRSPFPALALHDLVTRHKDKNP